MFNCFSPLAPNNEQNNVEKFSAEFFCLVLFYEPKGLPPSQHRKACETTFSRQVVARQRCSVVSTPDPGSRPKANNCEFLKPRILFTFFVCIKLTFPRFFRFWSPRLDEYLAYSLAHFLLLWLNTEVCFSNTSSCIKFLSLCSILSHLLARY